MCHHDNSFYRKYWMNYARCQQSKNSIKSPNARGWAKPNISLSSALKLSCTKSFSCNQDCFILPLSEAIACLRLERESTTITQSLRFARILCRVSYSILRYQSGHTRILIWITKHKGFLLPPPVYWTHEDSDLDTLSLYNFWELPIKLSSKSREGLP
jgi:hypothetical protein